MSATESALQAPPAAGLIERRRMRLLLLIATGIVALSVLLSLNFGSYPPSFTVDAPWAIGLAVLVAGAICLLGTTTLVRSRMCPLCARRIPGDSVFCPYCGQRLP